MNLSQKVSRTIHNLLNAETSGNGNDFLQIDVLRSLQEQSKLLYECQMIYNALDSDPFYCYKTHPDDDDVSDGSGDDEGQVEDELMMQERREKEQQIQEFKVCKRSIP